MLVLCSLQFHLACSGSLSLADGNFDDFWIGQNLKGFQLNIIRIIYVFKLVVAKNVERWQT